MLTRMLVGPALLRGGVVAAEGTLRAGSGRSAMTGAGEAAWRCVITALTGQDEASLVSVIIPTYNYARYLPSALRSLQLQTHANWECLVVDDGSTDDTAAVVGRTATRDPRVRYVAQDNLGMSAARNRGIAAASGTYIQFLDADDALQARKLEIQVRYLEAHAEADIVLGAWGHWDGSDSLLGTRTSDPPLPEGAGERVVEALLRGNMIAVNAPLVRAEVVRAVGGFDERIGAHEDWEYWLRCALMGVQYARVSGAASMALVRRHRTSVSQDSVRMLDGAIRVRRRVDHELSEPWQRRLNRALLADAEVWLGTRLGVHGALVAGMRLGLRGAIRARSARHLLRVAAIPFAATPPGRWVGARLWPRLFAPGLATTELPSVKDPVGGRSD